MADGNSCRREESRVSLAPSLHSSGANFARLGAERGNEPARRRAASPPHVAAKIGSWGKLMLTNPGSPLVIQVRRRGWCVTSASVIALVALLALPARQAIAARRSAASSGGGGSIGNGIGNAAGDAAGDAAGAVIGITAAVVAVAGLGIWWFFFHDSGEQSPAGLTAQGGPVDVSSGARVGLDCPGAGGSPSVACW